MAMAAGGGRGQILGGGEGFGLAFKADTLWVGMRTKAATGPGGNLDSTTAAVSRLRTALEGSQSMTIASRMALTPSIEIGIRQDGGDAETGRGMDLGAGLVLADGVTGLAVDIRVRRLLVHQAEGFAESGMSISVSYNPTPSTPLGFTARVSPAWGGDAMSGAEALWGRESMGGMARNHLIGGGNNRLDTEVGYGLPIGARFVGTPRVGVRNVRVRPRLPDRLRDAGTRAGAPEPGARRWTPNDGRARCSTCRRDPQAPTSACSGARPCSGSGTRPHRPLPHEQPGTGRAKVSTGARSQPGVVWQGTQKRLPASSHKERGTTMQRVAIGSRVRIVWPSTHDGLTWVVTAIDGTKGHALRADRRRTMADDGAHPARTRGGRASGYRKVGISRRKDQRAAAGWEPDDSIAQPDRNRGKHRRPQLTEAEPGLWQGKGSRPRPPAPESHRDETMPGNALQRSQQDRDVGLNVGPGRCRTGSLELSVSYSQPCRSGDAPPSRCGS